MEEVGCMLEVSAIHGKHCLVHLQWANDQACKQEMLKGG
jgi:hypothetical protein